MAGHWRWTSGRLTCDLISHAATKNVLYAFVCDNEVKYVGKTVRPLRVRMYGYENPGASQSTNVRLNRLITESLQADAAVDILVLPDNGLLHYGRFHINLAAGLEDNIIAELQPAWNGSTRNSPLVEISNAEDGSSSPADTPADEIGGAEDASGPPVVTHSFEFTLQPTYFKSGFFNVPVAASGWFGDDGQEIEIFRGGESQPITGLINRAANRNRTPRIFGGADLRDWLQANLTAMDAVRVDLYSPVSIRIGAVPS